MRIGQEFKKRNPQTELIVFGVVTADNGIDYKVKVLGERLEQYINREELDSWEDVDSPMLYESYTTSRFMDVQ